MQKITLQHWRGVVHQIDNNKYQFFAVLDDITNGGTQEEVNLSFSDISNPNDIQYLQKGATFDWFIREKEYDNFYSVIRFKKHSGFTKKQIEKARKRAQDLMKYID